MRTSIQLEDHIHEYASVYASARGISLSAAINELVRRAQTGDGEAFGLLYDRYVDTVYRFIY